MSTQQIIAICPVCEAEITISPDVEESEIIECPECGSRLVVESVDRSGGKITVTLSPAPEVEEDWGE